MKNEFNIRSGAATQRYLRAMAFLVPPILTVGLFHGWQGLMLFSSFTALAAHWHMQQNPRAWNDRMIEGQTRRGHFQSFGRLQKIADRVADRFQMPHTPIWRVSPQSDMRNQTKNAQTDGHIILIAQDYEQNMTDEETEWVIAHELDHARHPTDTMAISAYKGARFVLGAIGAYTAWQLVDNMVWTMQHLKLSTAAAASFIVSFDCLKNSFHAQSQGNEFRADSNALQNTGQLIPAIHALKKATGLPPVLCDIFSKVHSRSRLDHTHPSLEERFANMRVIAAKMQDQDAKTGHAPTP